MEWGGWPHKLVHHTSLVAVITLTDRLRSVRYRYVIESFGGFFFALSLCFFKLSLV